jgi:tetratricopeptide (TPR) repeat protein
MKPVFVISVVLCLTFFVRFTVQSQQDGANDISKQLILADGYLENLNYDSAEYRYAQVLAGFEKEKDWSGYCSIVNKYIRTLWRNEKYLLSKEYAYRNLENCLEYLGKENPETGRSYLNLGVLNFLTGNGSITHEYYTKALDVFNNNFGELNDESAEVYEWLGAYHCGIVEKVPARSYLDKALILREKLNETNDYRAGDLYRYFGLYYKRFVRLDIALDYFCEAKKLFDKKYSKYNFKSIKCRNNINDINEEILGFDTVLSYHFQTLDLVGKGKVSSRYALMMTYFNIAELYNANGYFKEALLYMQKVLKLYFPNIDENSIYSNPEDMSNANKVIKYALHFKAVIMTELYNQDTINNFDCLINSVRCYELTIKAIEILRAGVINIEDLVSYEHKNNFIYQDAADNAFKAYEMTGDALFLSKALTYLSSNKNRNHLLFDRQMEKMFVSNIPKSYINKKNLIQKELNLLLSRQKGRNRTEVTDSLNIRIAEKKIELDLLAYNMFENNPDLINSILEKTSVSFKDLQNKLNDDQTLIWYSDFCTGYNKAPPKILVVMLKKDTLLYHKVNKGIVISLLINDLYKMSSNDIYTLEKGNSSGYRLFRYLFPINRNDLTKELIIIPSQTISMVPFDALPIESGLHPKRMIDKYIIWKEFSAFSFLQDNGKTQNEMSRVLAVAPRFNRQQKQTLALLIKRDTSLINLPGAIKECESLELLFDTKVLTGENATLQAFETYCPDYQIIHLSTHAVYDNNNKSSIRLVFSDYQNNNNGTIDIYDVLNLPVNANLVVLSACNTAAGEMTEGEGNLNLAWAFNKAGAKSVLVSLWDANDYASSVIMPKFYKYLSEGMTKPEALHFAKLDFIKSADEMTSSPYFWAGFDYWGGDNAIINTAYTSETKFISVLLIILMGSFLFLFFRQK